MSNISVLKTGQFTGHKDCIYTVERSSKDYIFYSGAGDGLVAMWDITQGEDGQLIAKLKNSIYALHYFDLMDLLIIGQNFNGIHLVDPAAKKEVGSLQLNDKAIFDIKTYQHIAFVATGDGTVFVIDLEKLVILDKIKLSDKSARCLAINLKTKELAVGYSDFKIRLFDLENFQLKKTIEAHKNSVFTIKFSPNYRYLISGSRDAHLKTWDVNGDYKLADDIVAHMYAINNIEFSPDDKYFVTCSMDKSIKVWDAEAMKLLKVIDKSRHAGHGTSINKLLWLPFDNTLVAASDDKSISVWDINIKL